MENRVDIDAECTELKALIVELVYNNPCDETGEVTADGGAAEMELYSEINLRINCICQYVHKLQKDVYIHSEMVKVLQNGENCEQDLQSL